MATKEPSHICPVYLKKKKKQPLLQPSVATCRFATKASLVENTLLFLINGEQRGKTAFPERKPPPTITHSRELNKCYKTHTHFRSLTLPLISDPLPEFLSKRPFLCLEEVKSPAAVNCSPVAASFSHSL